MRIAINGFGRIGRLVVRALAESTQHKDLQLVAINDLGTPDANAHLLRYDSLHTPFAGEVHVRGDAMTIRAQNTISDIAIFAERDPAKLPWKAQDVDCVLECTGLFTSHEKASAHIAAGAKRVLISAPSADADITVVYGVNHTQVKPAHAIISNGSCTTNCLAPVAKVLQETCGIQHGYMTTIHAYTGDQRLQDSLHKDLRRARAAGMSLIPTSTGAAKAIGLVLPELNGRLDGTAVRVPTGNVSLVDFVFEAKSATSIETIHNAMTKASTGPLAGILAVNDAPLVSVDFLHNPHSAIFDLTQTQIVDTSQVRILAWYDNEWGFSNRMLDMAQYLHAHMHAA